MGKKLGLGVAVAEWQGLGFGFAVQQIVVESNVVLKIVAAVLP
jgi:hypothetical protein